MALSHETGKPLFDGYFADPFVLRVGESYFAYGTGTVSGFEVLTSNDLLSWTSLGPCLEPLDESLGDAYWAPEVAFANGRYWMYFSVGHDIVGHHIRVASSISPTGPFVDLGLNLTPTETFAIDAHPFRASTGEWFLYFARDVLDDPRPGTHLAVAPLHEMTRLDVATPVLAPNDDWQIYERGRAMYESVYDWHTLEGPTVVERHGAFWLTFSGGSWEGAGYGVSWARADHPLGPWMHAPEGSARILETTATLTGPGHSSLTTAPSGGDVIVFHAWDAGLDKRRMFANYIDFPADGPPRLGDPL